jgi:uncharacterized protein YabE (DUF348 family)
LDESHFTAPDISSGRATFTSDAGVDYTIRILGQGDDCNVSSYAEDEDDLLQDQDDKEEEQNQLQEDSDRSQEEMEEDESSQNEEEPD